MPMTEAAIDAGLLRDVYVSLGEPIDERAWSVRVYYKPFVDWIWGGCLLMALGGFLAMRPALPAAEEGGGHLPGSRSRHEALLLPLGIFIVLVVFPRHRPHARSARSALAAGGQAGAAFEAAATAQAEATFSPKDMQGKVWLLNVWASWCVSCRQEHPILVELAKSGLVPIYGLNYKDQLADALMWLKQYGDPYALSIVDAEGRVGIDYGVYGVPETYVIDKAGMSSASSRSARSRQESLEKTILPLVKELQK
jgi:cytochrome c biogenesis protein CcmG/thiol:disulfide interchange protein DsbE